MSIEKPDINIIPKEEVPEKKDEQIPITNTDDEERINTEISALPDRWKDAAEGLSKKKWFISESNHKGD